jgi:mannose-6-phosphate isomerase-like protein (cupin superfamily)
MQAHHVNPLFISGPTGVSIVTVGPLRRVEAEVQKICIKGQGPPWNGQIEGGLLGGGISVILTHLGPYEKGPDLHRHPYDETFFIFTGGVSFSDGTTVLDAKAGDLVVVPAGAPHRFDGLNHGVEMIDIHASNAFSTEWL